MQGRTPIKNGFKSLKGRTNSDSPASPQRFASPVRSRLNSQQSDSRVGALIKSGKTWLEELYDDIKKTQNEIQPDEVKVFCDQLELEIVDSQDRLIAQSGSPR